MTPPTRQSWRRFRPEPAPSTGREPWIWTAVTVAAFVLAIAAWIHFKPAPPSEIVLAVAPDECGSKYFTRRYKAYLEAHGVQLRVVTTEGSARNVALLADPASDVDIAFVQGGTEPKPGLMSLGSLTHVPLWLFYRGDEVDDPSGLAGRRVAVGPKGAASSALTTRLFELAGAAGAATQLLPMTRDEGVAAFEAGKVDAVAFAESPEARVVQRLAAKEGVRLLSFGRGEAFARTIAFVNRLQLARGVLDLRRDVPARDVTLLAQTTNLVARAELHPAVGYLLLAAAREIHGRGGLIDNPGEFPAPLRSGFDMSPQASRTYASGPPLIFAALPYWIAIWVDRLWLMVLPLLAVVLPVARVLPALYGWRMRAPLNRMYARLKAIELEAEAADDLTQLDALRERLQRLSRDVMTVRAPLSYAEHLYIFQEHIELLERRIEVRRTLVAAAATATDRS